MKYFLLPLVLLLEVLVFFVDKILFVGILLALPVLFVVLFVLHTFAGLWDSGVFGRSVIIFSLAGLLACFFPAISHPVPPPSPEMQQKNDQEVGALLLKGLPTPYPWVTPNSSLSPPHPIPEPKALNP